MALGLNTGGGEGGGNFLPYAKYDARAGKLFKVVRTQQGDGWKNDDVEITSPPPAFAVDFASIEVGWICYTGGPPSFAVVPLGQAMPQRPNSDHKQGFRVKLAGQIVDGVREFSSTSKCVMSAIDALHSLYLAAPEAAQGKIPLVRMTGTTAVKTPTPGGTTTNYAPVFVVEGWVDRPEGLGPATASVPAAGAQAAPAAQPTTQAPPPGHMPPPAAGGGAARAEMPF